ncbi:dienelactone hydrolase family protein [Vannielia litorea]|uniref:dienelactone hydrolase family protein n=1 Tax=Vannielia litorea TaxID=1217970 RepID=UPI001C96776F|nr:dienelactone hydrolase family protein [Vannielia litorea]MBY6154087.1 dienelactone hydrolase family protein [Vannielia litorea]
MQHQDQTYEGFSGTLVTDPAHTGPRPGVLVFHSIAWRGPIEMDAAERLAAMGYAAFVADTYGRAPEGPEDCREMMNALNADRAELRRRIEAALNWMRGSGATNGQHGAIGFCFGGKCVLDLARLGEADVKAVASFHGLFDRPTWETAATIPTSVLALHGWDDPLAKPDEVLALAEEFDAAQADWQILAMGGVSHAFTNPGAKDKAGGKNYDARATERAWAATESLFAEAFRAEA